MSGVSQEQQEIRALAREFAAAELRPHVERWDHDAAFDEGVLLDQVDRDAAVEHPAEKLKAETVAA